MKLRKRFVSFYVSFNLEVMLTLLLMFSFVFFAYMVFFIPCNEKFVCGIDGCIKLGTVSTKFIVVYVITLNSFLYIYLLGYVIVRKEVRKVKKGKYEEGIRMEYEKIKNKKFVDKISLKEGEDIR